MEISEQDGTLLYDLASECETLLEGQTSALREQVSPLADLGAEYQQRFAIWAAHLGVFARKSQCLDTRLRNYPDIQDLVARLLDILRQSLHASQKKPGQEDEDNQVTRGNEEQRAGLAAVEATLSRLNRLGVTIRQASRGRIDVKVKTFAANLDTRPFADAAQVVVQTLYPNAHQSLREYLGKTMTERYAAILYLRHRREKLQSRRPLNSPFAGPQLPTIGEGVQAGKGRLPPVHDFFGKGPAASQPFTKIPYAGSQSDLSTVNTKLLRHALQRTANFEAPTERRTGTSSVQVSQGNYPGLPRGKEGNYITCEWCTKAIDKRVTNEADWR